MLVDGKWSETWKPVSATDAKGGFVRQVSSFRSWVTPDGAAGPTGEGGFRAEPGRYHLYAVIRLPVGDARLDRPQAQATRGCRFRRDRRAHDDRPGLAVRRLSRHRPRHGERCDLPARDLHPRRSAFHRPGDGSGFVGQGAPDDRQQRIRRPPPHVQFGLRRARRRSIDLCPEDLRRDIDALNEATYASLNNGVYRAGFATTQAAYEEAFGPIFATLDMLERKLEAGPFLFGDRLTETDIRVFVTLARFDAAYHGLFKCNLRRIADHANVSAYLARLIAIPAFRETFNLDHIKRGYYSIKALNPTRIVPLGPELRWAPRRG